MRQVIGIVLLMNAVAVIGAALTGNLPNWPPGQHDIHVAERSLPTGRDLCVGHRLIQRNPIERAADLRDGGARPDERCRLRHATSLRK